jgi:hypothetical protein
LDVNSQYLAYLIRLQRAEGRADWRATLENVHTHETLNFVTERELLAYLLQILSERPSSSNTNPNSDNESES